MLLLLLPLLLPLLLLLLLLLLPVATMTAADMASVSCCHKLVVPIIVA